LLIVQRARSQIVEDQIIAAHFVAITDVAGSADIFKVDD